MDENQYMFSQPGSIMPRLTNQTAYDTISDPLIRQLYFGSAGSPGFFNQLLAAGQQAAGQIQGGLGMYMPYLQQAEDYGRRAFGEITPEDISTYYDPYEDRVVEQTIDDLVEQAGIQDVAARAEGIKAAGEGSFGSRGRLLEGERAEALGRGLGQAVSGIRSAGFQKAFDNLFRGREAAGKGAEFQRGLATLAPSLYYGDVGRNLGLLSTIAGMLPGYRGSSTQLTSQYGIPPDPKALGLGAGLGFFGNFDNPVEYDPRQNIIYAEPEETNNQNTGFLGSTQLPNYTDNRNTGFFGAPIEPTNPFGPSQFSNPFGGGRGP